jgi:hypothetical protein
MKLSEIKGQKAIEVIGDIIEPATEILSDPKVKFAARSKNIAAAASIALKNHPAQVLRVLAVLDGEDPETYSQSLLEIPKKLIDLLNDPELMSLFTSSDQTEAAESSGPQSANTEDR